MSAQKVFPCPCCKHTNWQPGKIVAGGQYGVGFIPDGRGMMFLGYSIRPFVCGDCGYIAQFLAMEDVQDLWEKKTPRKRKRKEAE